ncbi:MAG: class I SAM-dependent rRNA methyltransferase [Planctomycetota bacterium]
MSLPTLRLRVRVRGRHPWFYRKMIRRPAVPIPAGSAVLVVDREGRTVGTGFYNGRTDLALRMICSDVVEDPDRLLVARLERAARLREEILDLRARTNAWRVVHSEGDGFPGVVIDQLADVHVAIAHSLAMLERMEPLGLWFRARNPSGRLVLLQDEDAISREGMGRLPRPRPIPVVVHEHGLEYEVEAGGGHKTGFFADQRDNRLLARSLARGRRVLDLCCYSGGFAMNALAGGARSVRAVDLDEYAVARAKANLARNRLRGEVEHGDAFDALRAVRRGDFDLVVLDPPKWVPNRAALEDGLRRYRDLNRLALEKLRPGGILITCSCSGSVSPRAFAGVLMDAAADAGVDARILRMSGAAPDHPVALECPETAYLKAAFLEVRS